MSLKKTEGETWLGSEEITTDDSGHKEFDFTLPVATVDGAHISVTATDPLGNTSEFSQRIIFSMSCPLREHEGDDYCGCHVSCEGTYIVRAPRPDDIFDNVSAFEQLHAGKGGAE